MEVSDVEGPRLQVCLTVVPHHPTGDDSEDEAASPCCGSFADLVKYLLSSAGRDTIFSKK